MRRDDSGQVNQKAESRFWMCWVGNTTGELHRSHNSLGEATSEATRLAQNNIGKKVYILEAGGYFLAERPSAAFVKLG